MQQNLAIIICDRIPKPHYGKRPELFQAYQHKYRKSSLPWWHLERQSISENGCVWWRHAQHFMVPNVSLPRWLCWLEVLLRHLSMSSLLLVWVLCILSEVPFMNIDGFMQYLTWPLDLDCLLVSYPMQYVSYYLYINFDKLPLYMFRLEQLYLMSLVIHVALLKPAAL